MLARIKGHITHRPLNRISPLAIPVMLEIGKEPVSGEAHDAVLAEAAEDLIAEAMGPAVMREATEPGRSGENGQWTK
jgi:ATP-dependent Lhr-like helicase